MSPRRGACWDARSAWPGKSSTVSTWVGRLDSQPPTSSRLTGWLPGDEASRPAVAYIGSRPTVDAGERMVETHLLDFDGNLYGQTLATDLLERIRPDARFESLDDLIAQMQLDKAQALDILARG